MMQAIGRSAPLAVVFCAALYLLALTQQFDFPRAPGRLGPDVWPRALLVLLMLACAIGIARNLLATRRSTPPTQEPDQPATSPDQHQQPAAAASRYGLVIGGLLLFIAYPLTLEYLGFPLATFLLMMLFMLVGQWRSPLGLVAVSAIGTLVLFYVFRGVVYVSLPLGTGPFHSATVWIASLLGMR